MDKDRESIKEYILKAIITISLLSLAAVILKYSGEIMSSMKYVISICTPFICGGCIAYILMPLCNRLEKFFTKHHVKNAFALSIGLAETILVIIVTLVLCIIIPQGAESLGSIVNKLPETLENTEKNVSRYIDNNKEIMKYVQMVQEQFNGTWQDKINPMIDNVATSIINKTVSLGTTVANLLFGIVISIFVLYHRGTFLQSVKKILYAICGKKVYDIIIEEIRVTDKMFSGFMYGKVIDSLIVGLICMSVLSLMQIPYALIVSVIVCITNIIPIAGPIIGAVPGTIIIFSESPISSLYFIVFIIILQQIDGHIIGPKCIGNATGLNTFWVLFAIIFFGRLWGILGMLIGVPLMAVILDIVQKITNIAYTKRLAHENRTKGEATTSRTSVTSGASEDSEDSEASEASGT